MRTQIAGAPFGAGDVAGAASGSKSPHYAPLTERDSDLGSGWEPRTPAQRFDAYCGVGIIAGSLGTRRE